MSQLNQELAKQPPAELMENVEAVDVSWLHHSSKGMPRADALTRARSTSSSAPPQHLQQSVQQVNPSSNGRRASTASTNLARKPHTSSSTINEQGKEKEHTHHNTQTGLFPKPAEPAAPLPTNTSAAAHPQSCTSSRSTNSHDTTSSTSTAPQSAGSSPTVSSRPLPPSPFAPAPA
ncbi:hypothetical protein KEM54_004796, partial [Ascosphaera aggregata]